MQNIKMMTSMLELEHFFIVPFLYIYKGLGSYKWPRHHNKTLETIYNTLATP